MIPALALAVASCLAVASWSPAHATDIDPLTQKCIDSWEDSPASDYCSWGTNFGAASTICIVASPSCSITVSLVSESTGTTESLTRVFTSDGSIRLQRSHSQMEDFDLCFYNPSRDEWYMHLLSGCLSHHIDSATAVADGLPVQ